MAKKRILLLEIDERQDIRLKINHSTATKKQKDAMLKDCHLIESAIATDQRIVSLDDTARDLFKSELNVHDVNGILWVNPNVDAEQVLVWLENGAPEHHVYKLS